MPFNTLKYYFDYCILFSSVCARARVCVFVLCMCMCGQFSLSTFLRVPGIKLTLSGFCGKFLYLLSHFTGSSLVSEW